MREESAEFIERLNHVSENFNKYSDALEKIRLFNVAAANLRALASQGRHCPTEAYEAAVRNLAACDDALSRDRQLT